MGLLSATQIEQYRAVLNKILKTLAAQQHESGRQAPARLTDLINDLSGIISLLKESNNEKIWFDRYLGFYESYFFDSELQKFTELVHLQYLQPWNSLALDDKLENGRMNTGHLRLINTPGFTDNTYKTQVINKYKPQVKHLDLVNNTTVDIGKAHDFQRGADIFTFIITDKENNKVILCTWCRPDFIHITENDEGFSEQLKGAYLDVLYKLILSF